MGLLNTRNLQKAKQLLDQIRHKVGDMVEKAGGSLDKATKGRTAQYTQKATEAAHKYSAGAGATTADDVLADDSAAAPSANDGRESAPPS
ncbi:MAG: antitoxin [Actinomycetota bacterium]